METYSIFVEHSFFHAIFLNKLNAISIQDIDGLKEGDAIVLQEYDIVDGSPSGKQCIRYVKWIEEIRHPMTRQLSFIVYFQD